MLSWLMLSIILLAGIGTPLYAHTCLISGQTSVAVWSTESGCSDMDEAEDTYSCCPNEAKLESTSCCLDETAFLKTDLTSTPLSGKAIAAVPPVMVAVLFFVFANLLLGELFRPYRSDNGPPLPYGRDLLHRIHVLRP